MVTQLNNVQAKSKKADKRQAIVEAARELFTTEGYETTTIAQVAKKAGVAVGTVYLYFKNKTELLSGVRGDYEEEFVAYMTRPELQAIPHHLRVRPMIEAAFSICEQASDMIQIMGLPPQMIGIDKQHKDVQLLHLALAEFFREAQAVGAIRSDLDPQVGAVVALGMVKASLEQCYEVEAGKNKEVYINTLVDALSSWLIPTELKV
ncbi:MAG TPA: TetR/AcrR family transcriptional regulator [Chloroflexia bacterium]|nr:TetR/AcrR family transcriptional regulator [Chloroflexia bacterium]